MKITPRSMVLRRPAILVGTTLLTAVAVSLSGHSIEALGGLNGIIYVTDRAQNRVWALDAADGTILATGGTGTRPIGVEQANGKVYTANETSGTISVFDACTLEKVKEITACPKPHHTHTSPDRSRLYVACFATNQIAVINTETDERDEVWTSGGPTAVTHQPWATKDGESVWASNTVSRDITELDAATGAILRRIPTRANPVETVTPSNGKLAYVSIASDSKLQVFDLATNTLSYELDVPSPENLMISGNGKRILASKGGQTFPHTFASIIDASARVVTTIDLPGTLATHNDLTNNGKYGFVSLEGSPNGVAVIDMDAATIRDFYSIPNASSPHGVRWAPSCGY